MPLHKALNMSNIFDQSTLDDIFPGFGEKRILTEKEKQEIIDLYKKHNYPTSYPEVPPKYREAIVIPKDFDPHNSHHATEMWCEAFAAYLLMPTEWIEPDIKAGKSIEEMAKKYMVEEGNVCFRLILYYFDNVGADA